MAATLIHAAPIPLATTPRRRRSSINARRLSEPPAFVRTLGYLLIVSFVVLPLALAFVPWRQAVAGHGAVLGFDPLERPFTVDSPIYGRVVQVFVSEGQHVNQGDPIAKVEDIDSQYLATLEAQRDLAIRGKDLAELTVTAYESVKVQAENERLRNNEEARAMLDAATQKIIESESKVVEIEVEVREDAFKLDQSNKLLARGLESVEKNVEAQRNLGYHKEKLAQARSALEQAKQAVSGYQAKLEATEAKGLALVQKAEADLQTARGKLQDELTKVGDYEVKIRRQLTQAVTAPRAGTVFRLHTNVGSAAQVKDGDPIATIVPRTTQLAAELYLPGRDVPLVRVGDPVRLQFDGWPAVQFMGWPSVAVGTFPGRVAVIDPSQSKGGKFRILVVPEPNMKGRNRAHGPNTAWQRDADGWPSERFLRQGAGARGWILLETVPLGFEFWRRLNGFPPTIAEDEPTADAGKDGQAPPPAQAEKEIKVKRPK